MNTRHNDINDDEIRIISSAGGVSRHGRRHRLTVWLCVAGALLVAVVLALLFFPSGSPKGGNEPVSVKDAQPLPDVLPAEEPSRPSRPFTVRRDTLVDGVGLSILTPVGSTPVLEIGNGALNDSTAVLVVQAADVRGDNGGIVGSCVVKGELVSKGEAKAGFCAIVNGEITVGVADATPAFEQALTTDGYFFRQYPLVVGGQVVENRPRGKSIRRALAEIDGRISVVVSHERLTFHDFSQALVDAGVRNAIYLVGGRCYGRYTDASGESLAFGPAWDNNARNEEIRNVNYIVWR